MKIIRPFVRTNEKMAVIADKMKTSFLYACDKFRGERESAVLMDILFGEGRPNEHYEIGDFGGILSATNIVDGEECGGMIKIWDSGLWGKTLVRDIAELMSDVMDKHNLKRIRFSTADPRMAKMAILCGIKIDRVVKNGFVFDGKAYDLFHLSKERQHGD